MKRVFATRSSFETRNAFAKIAAAFGISDEFSSDENEEGFIRDILT